MDRFLAAGDFPDACVPWPFGRTKRGYGTCGRRNAAHRYAWEKTHGEKAGRRCVRHTCDTPACVNPRHLLIGTHAQNSRDAVERGRVSRGEQHTHAKLTVPDVIAIRAAKAAGETDNAVAARYGVTRSLVSMIKTRRVWAHVP